MKNLSILKKKKNFEKIFDDIIVGLKIIDNWKDNTNGEFTLQDPILKKNILITFDGKILRDISFDIEIFLLKNPDKITIN